MQRRWASEASPAAFPLGTAWYPRYTHCSTYVVSLTQPTRPSPPAILVHAANSPTSADTLLRTHLHAKPGMHVAHVSPLIACTPRLLFSRVVRQWGGKEACADLGAFLLTIKKLAAHNKLVLVVHDAERTRDVWPESVWEMLPLLAELAELQGRLVVVFRSTLPWAAFRDTSGRTISAAPISLYIPRLPRDDVLTLLASDVDACDAAFAEAYPNTPLPDAKALRTLHKHYAALLYDSIKGAVRDEHEIRTMAAAIWRVLLVTVHEKQTTNLAALMPSISELIRDALHQLVPRTVGPTQWIEEKEKKARAPPTTAPALPFPWPGRTGFPAMSAFLLISAFLASYNPTKTDVKYFVRELGNSRKRKRRGKGQTAADAALLEDEGEKEIWSRPQFWGPRTFTLERLLAIYHALLADFEQDLNEDALLAANDRASRTHDNPHELHLEHVAGEFWSRSATALAQINELVAQKLLVRMSPAGKLGSMQYRVNMPYTQLKALAHSVGFPLDVWLWDRYT